MAKGHGGKVAHFMEHKEIAKEKRSLVTHIPSRIYSAVNSSMD